MTESSLSRMVSRDRPPVFHLRENNIDLASVQTKRSSKRPQRPDLHGRYMHSRAFFRPNLGYVAALLVTVVVIGCGETPPAPEGASLATVAGDRVSVDSFEARVEELMDRALVPGLGCSIINEGRVVYHRTFGFRDMETGELLTDDSVFNAASFSKTVFAYLVTLFVDEGLVDLDRPLHEYLEKPIPEYESYADLAGDDRWLEITARMALSHSIGFPNWRMFTDDNRLSFLFDPGARIKRPEPEHGTARCFG